MLAKLFRLSSRRLTACAVLLGSVLNAALAAPHTVAPGETLYSLARASGTSVNALMDLNHLTSPDLKVGQVIQLPDPPAATAPVAPAAPAPAPRHYIV
ncbi:MAG TPA: LysM peptidoglycan-binding domain-containing protein, partial [Deinococcales bacterium]|nr:LysM peptidoglycan-binding domain-containing protein [Deinococcales bacterium]